MEKQPKKPEPKTVALDQLNVKVTNPGNTEFVNESGRTVMVLLMQEDGKILTSFLGDYNKTILNTLEKVNKLYFKSLKKQLLKPKKQKRETASETNKQENQKKPSNKTKTTSPSKAKQTNETNKTPAKKG